LSVVEFSSEVHNFVQNMFTMHARLGSDLLYSGWRLSEVNITSLCRVVWQLIVVRSGEEIWKESCQELFAYSVFHAQLVKFHV